jgi:hypothetical protein
VAGPPPFEVIESDAFLEHVSFLIGDFPHWDEVSATLKLDLARSPLEVPTIEGTELRAVRIEQLGRAIFYTVQEEARTITLEAMF